MQTSQRELSPNEIKDSAVTGAARRPQRILIVDDEPTLRLGFSVALATDGFDPEEAEDGDAAIRALTNSGAPGFDAMLLDLRMPGKSGIDVIQALSELEVVVPTIIVSAYIDSASAVRAIEFGVVDFLQKPITPNDLRGVVGHVLAEEARLRADTGSDSEASLSDLIAKARWKLRRRDLAGASDLLRRVDEMNGATDNSTLVNLSLWRMIVRHLDYCRNDKGGNAGTKTDFASSRFYEATNLLDYLAYKSE